MRRPDQRSLHSVLKAELLRYIRELDGRGETQLPPEAELSEQLGVSRPTLRAVALSLQKDGILTRVHGRGTFVNRRVLRLGTNMNLGQPFLTILRGQGHVASHRVVSAVRSPLTGDTAAKLDLAGPTPGLVVARQISADGRPAVLVVDHVPLDYLHPGWTGTFQESSFDFADDACKESIDYSIAEIIPGMATGEQAHLLACPEGTPLLLLEHVHFTRRDQPVMLTRACVNPEFIHFYVARTRTQV